ncbi:uncharacterized protein LOC125237392 isoform X10 [Leguminivora glycinivorella]|uniref:uncharacterized protein LOC125237392 isoform X10 n=1 Tax=Leguminivora glycinivorella TaxID=1035111 RepID=UPI00200E9F9D|nr:uncharacterized protein LOC125237392 isoform X10 [Leguminivora glycinivorella]
MPYHKCQYHNCDTCGSVDNDKSMFRFPVKDEHRLKLWVEHSGNKKLKSLTQQELKRRHLYLCEDHFKDEDIVRNTFRSRLVSTAVPLKEPKSRPSPQPSPQPRNSSPVPELRPEIKHTYKPRLLPKISKDAPVSAKEVTPPRNNEDPIPALVRKPEMPAVAELPVLQEVPIEPFIPKDELMDDDVDKMNNKCCKDCAAFTGGSPFWCVQCGRGPLCASCAERAPHDSHFLLRTPRGASRGQTLAVLAVIKQQLQAENLLELYEVNDSCVKVEIKVEPEEFLSPEPSEPDSGPQDHLGQLPNYPDTSEQIDEHEDKKYSEVRPLPNYRRKIQSTTVIQDTSSSKTVLGPTKSSKFASKRSRNQINDQTVEEYLAKRRLLMPETVYTTTSLEVASERSQYQLDTNESVDGDYLAKSYLPVPDTGQ